MLLLDKKYVESMARAENLSQADRSAREIIVKAIILASVTEK
jgi:hypothetical protein